VIYISLSVFVREMGRDESASHDVQRFVLLGLVFTFFFSSQQLGYFVQVLDWFVNHPSSLILTFACICFRCFVLPPFRRFITSDEPCFDCFCIFSIV
jgi:hypothetical protein